MTNTPFVWIKQCIECFHFNDKDKNTCGLCGHLMDREITYQSKEYQERYKTAIEKKFAESDKKRKSDLDISDLEAY